MSMPICNLDHALNLLVHKNNVHKISSGFNLKIKIDKTINLEIAKGLFLK